MSNTPLNAGDELRSDIEILVKGILVESAGGPISVDVFTKEVALDRLMQLVATDRKKHELQARVDELSKLGGFLFVGDIHVRGRHQRSYDDRIAELKQELEKL